MENPVLENYEIQKSDMIHFENGILGFEEYRDYVLMQDEELPFLMVLQSVASEHPSFLLMDPYAVLEKYEPMLPDADRDYFGHDSDLRYLVIAVMPDEVQKTAVNLKSPIVIDSKTHRAKQVILENRDYPIRHFLFDN